MLQKALHNAVNHNGVHQFDVQLSGTSNEIHLTVKGSLSILSEPRRGTTPRSRSFHFNQGFCTGGRIETVGSPSTISQGMNG